MIVTTWVIPRNAALGNYTLTVKAITTIKFPSDSDQFNVTSAVLQLSRLSTDATDYQRTQNVTLHATLLYPGQSIVLDGYLEFQVVQPDGSVFLTSTALPDGSGGYVASFKIPSAAPIGSWQIIVPAWQSGDPSGNNGPTTPSAVRFAVSPSLVMAILAPVGALIAFIAWRLVPRRKRLSVALETEKVMQTVNKVQSTDFFRSIRDQLATASSLRNEK